MLFVGLTRKCVRNMMEAGGDTMRLWHEALIPHLDRQRLLGQHRECAALRGLGWGKKHSTVDYVFRYSPMRLYWYHMKVIDECANRGYRIEPWWCLPFYRGQYCEPWGDQPIDDGSYPEHNAAYLAECIANLAEKGVDIAI